jgi:hypothetical protein
VPDERLRVDAWRLPSAIGRFLLERSDAKDVIDVMVREDGAVEGRLRTPAAHGGVQRSAVAGRAGIEHRQTGAGVDRAGAGETLVEEHALGYLFAVGGEHPQRVHILVIDRSLPVLFREFSNPCHHSLLC